MVAYERLNHIGSKFCLISIWKLKGLTQCFKCFICVKSQFREKYSTSNWETSIPYTTQECDNGTTSNIQFLVCYLSSDRSQEVKDKRKFQTFSSTSGRDCLREVVPKIKVPKIMTDLETFGIFGKLVAEERWSLTTSGCKWRLNCRHVDFHFFGQGSIGNSKIVTSDPKLP